MFLRRRGFNCGLAAAATLMAMAAGTAGATPPTASFCFNDWPPFASRGVEGPTGISIEIVAAAARRADVDVSFTELPWSRCLQLVRLGAYDGALDTSTRTDFLQGPVSVAAHRNTFWVRDGIPATSYDVAVLSQRSIGLVHGYPYPRSLLDDLARVGARVEWAVSDPANLTKLSAGRLDAIIADFASTLVAVRRQRLAVHALLPSHSVDRLYLSFNRQRTVLHRAFDDALGALRRDGFVDAVYRRYLGTSLDDILR